MAGENDDDEIAFTLERWFDAPRDLVWKVYTNAEHLSQWWGPSNFTWVKGTIDLKPGGMFHYGMRGPAGQIMWGKFVYREIAAPERLVFVNAFSDEHGGTTPNPWMPEWPLETLNTVTFTEENGRTLISMRGTAGERDRSPAPDVQGREDADAGRLQRNARQARRLSGATTGKIGDDHADQHTSQLSTVIARKLSNSTRRLSAEKSK